MGETDLEQQKNFDRLCLGVRPGWDIVPGSAANGREVTMDDRQSKPVGLHWRFGSFLIDMLPPLILVKGIGVGRLLTPPGGTASENQEFMVAMLIYLTWVLITEMLYRLLTPVGGRTPGMRVLNLVRLKNDQTGPPNLLFVILHLAVGLFLCWLVWWPGLAGRLPLHDRMFGFSVVHLRRAEF